MLVAFSEQNKKEDFDPGTKSEGEDDSQCSTIKEKNRASLGKTPNHLTLSTASTLSTGSTGSQARLIQSSQHPKNYQPPVVKDLGKITQLHLDLLLIHYYKQVIQINVCLCFYFVHTSFIIAAGRADCTYVNQSIRICFD